MRESKESAFERQRQRKLSAKLILLHIPFARCTIFKGKATQKHYIFNSTYTYTNHTQLKNQEINWS